jgi:Cu/Ag efflux protein CusF
MLSAHLSATTRRRATLLLLIAPLALSAQKRPIVFRGRVEGIDLNLRTVAVRHGEIPGFMPAMTMDYPIDNHSLLQRLSPGDEITATVYAGDPTLHDVRVTGHNSKAGVD